MRPIPVSNPPNPWASTALEYLGPPPAAPMEVFEERARSVLSRNESPDVPFRWSLNPYRGCAHACAYCYARPTHQYLGFGAGTDFDRRIVVKTNAAARLARAVAARSWRRELIAFSGATDCYQPLEAHYRLTRACLEVCAAHRTPVGIVTKSALVRRDRDVLAAMAADGLARVFVSIPFASDADARAIEPLASPPSERFRTLAVLRAVGIPVGVAVAPVIPGLNDHAIPEILGRAAEAGATRAFRILLRLPREVAPVFRERLTAAFPDRAGRVLAAVAESRGGRPTDSRFGARMRGEGPRWSVIARLFDVHCRRLGLAREEAGMPATDRPVSAPRPAPAGQGLLFR